MDEGSDVQKEADIDENIMMILPQAGILEEVPNSAAKGTYELLMYKSIG